MNHTKSELERCEALLERVWEFVHQRTDDVSVGVGRIMKPLEICGECGELNDYSQMRYCSCWSPVSESDIEQLEDLGFDARSGEPE